jgi:hypothetical protein
MKIIYEGLLFPEEADDEEDVGGYLYFGKEKRAISDAIRSRDEMSFV